MLVKAKKSNEVQCKAEYCFCLSGKKRSKWV